MELLIRYAVISSLCLSLAYIIYLLVFRNERNFKQRRFYLLGIVVFSLLIPLGDFYIKLDAPVNSKPATSFQFIEPPVNSEIQIKPIEQDLILQPAPAVQTPIAKEKNKINWIQFMLYIYFTVAVLLIFRIVFQVLVLHYWYFKSKQIKQSFFTLVFNYHYNSPFSFFKWIFIHDETSKDAELERIIAHEKVHVQQKHSLDTLLFELLCAIMWFNPLVWKMRNSIQLVHEYLADEGALNSGIDQLQYQVLMVNQVAEGNVVSISSHFSSSTIKKRMSMIVNSKFYTKTKYKILTIIPVAALLFLIIAGVNGLNDQKVMQRLLRKNEAISKTFNREEIKELAKIRVLVDKMVQNYTGESDTKTAYENYIKYLSESLKADEITDKIALPHDSLVQVINQNSTFQEIWKIDTLYNNSYHLDLNYRGKIMELIANLSEENATYSRLLDGIEIAGDVSPATITDFIKLPEHYNWGSEAEKLYASVLLVILNNKPIKKYKNTIIKNTQGIPNYQIYEKIDTTLVRALFEAYQANPSEQNAKLLYNVLPEKGHTRLGDTGRTLINEINRIGYLNNQNIKQLFELLQFKNSPNESHFITYGTGDNINIEKVSFSVREWLSYDDIKYLMSVLESEEECKCLVSAFSSRLPFKEQRGTIGGFATMFLNHYKNNKNFHNLVSVPLAKPEQIAELKEWWAVEKNRTTRTYKTGNIKVVVSQLKNNDEKTDEYFLCRGNIKTYKNNVPIDSLKYNDMEAVGDRYGFNFDVQPISDLIVGVKFGDYNGRLIIITETGQIENYPGGMFFIPENRNLIVSRWHSDLSGITIYNVEKKKVVMQKELPVHTSYWYYFQKEYYTAKWKNNKETTEIYKLDLDKFELIKSEKTLKEIRTGEKVEYLNSEFCDCN